MSRLLKSRLLMVWLLSAFAGKSCLTFGRGITRGQAATFLSGPKPTLRAVSACRAGNGEGHGAISFSKCRVAFPSDTCNCGGRSNQSGGGGEGAATTARARGVSESRVVPEDRGLPGDRASGGASPAR